MKSVYFLDSGNIDCKNQLFGHGVLENQIQAFSKTFKHWFKDFWGPCLFSKTFQALKIWKKKLKDFRGPARALLALVELNFADLRDRFSSCSVFAYFYCIAAFPLGYFIRTKD